MVDVAAGDIRCDGHTMHAMQPVVHMQIPFNQAHYRLIFGFLTAIV